MWRHHEGIGSIGQADLKLLNDPDELAIVRKLSCLDGAGSNRRNSKTIGPTIFVATGGPLVHPFYNKHRILPPMTDLDATRRLNFGNRLLLIGCPKTSPSEGLMASWSVQQVVTTG